MTRSSIRCAVVLAGALAMALGGAAQATLIGLWQFNEGAGTQTADASGNGLNGVLSAQTGSSVPAWITGQSGAAGDHALRFGVGGNNMNLVRAAYQPIMDNPSATHQVTLAAWVSSEEVYEGGILSMYNYGRVVQRNMFSLYLDSLYTADAVSGSLNLFGTDAHYYDNPATEIPVSPDSSTAPAWTHVAMTYDGTDMKFYVNGTLKDTFNAPGVIESDWYSWVEMGNQASYDRQLAGALDDVAIFDTALDQADVARIMGGDFTGFGPPAREGAHAYGAAVAALNPTHYYHFGEAGVVAHDSGVGTPIHGVLQQGNPGGADLVTFGPEPAGGEYGDFPGFGATPGNQSFGAKDVGMVYLGPGGALAAEQMTFSTWFGAPSGTGTIQWDRIFSNGQSDNNFQIAIHESESVSEAGLYIMSDDDNQSQTRLLRAETLNLLDSKWHHLVVTRDGDNAADMKLVIDGVDWTASLIGAPYGFLKGDDAGGAFLAGMGMGVLQRFSGLMDETAIWVGSALSVQDAIALYAAAFAPPPPGDANRDGVVDKKDAALLAAHWLSDQGVSWDTGDFNDDGVVDDLDLAILAANWTAQGGAAVPEPSMLAGLAALVLALLVARRRR
ncbi:MAG: PEP-CTERM sorting domain-containing protein [Pirellulales bacterium]|nr:PEP-CTERM sorting domain-containing protein [Pirellulales bacterium]